MCRGMVRWFGAKDLDLAQRLLYLCDCVSNVCMCICAVLINVIVCVRFHCHPVRRIVGLVGQVTGFRGFWGEAGMVQRSACVGFVLCVCVRFDTVFDR